MPPPCSSCDADPPQPHHPSTLLMLGSPPPPRRTVQWQALQGGGGLAPVVRNSVVARLRAGSGQSLVPVLAGCEDATPETLPGNLNLNQPPSPPPHPTPPPPHIHIISSGGTQFAQDIDELHAVIAKLAAVRSEVDLVDMKVFAYSFVSFMQVCVAGCCPGCRCRERAVSCTEGVSGCAEGRRGTTTAGAGQGWVGVA